MKKNDNLLINYFFVVGTTEEARQQILEEKINKMKICSSPEILSSYSAEGETPIFASIKENLNKNDDLRNNIFPMKSDYLDILLNNDYEEEKIKNIKNVFSDYIIETQNNNPPEHCYHCFQYELDSGTGHDLILNFGILIFYENIYPIEFQLKDINNTSKDINIYLGKALVLISYKPIFSLMKKILEKIYNDFVKLKYSLINLEPFIVNIFTSLNDKISKIVIENSKINEEKLINYSPSKDSILPFCDLNISHFLELFDINDILLLAEYYFLTKSIIIISPNYELLYPIYHILMTFFFPLNFHLKYYFYKVLYPDLVITGLCSILPCFYFIYSDKNKDNGYINDEILKKITVDKKDILIYQIVKSNDTENNKIKVNIEKNIYSYDNNNIFSKIPIKNRKNNTLIENVIKNMNNYNIYLLTINSEIIRIKKTLKKDEEEKTVGSFVESDFFNFPMELNSYDLLRKNFLGLIIKFIVIKIEPLTFRLNDDEKLEICPLTLNGKSEDNKNRNNKDDNIKLKDLKDFLEDSPQTEIIYKNEIIKYNFFDLDYLKTQILLDYFIKISKSDPNTLYFDEDNFNIKNENVKDDNEIKLKEIIFEDLFNYKQFLNSGKGKINKKNKEENNKIMTISNLEKYIPLDEEKIKDIFGDELNNAIFFDENFILDFDGFNNILDDFKLTKKGTYSLINNNDPIILKNPNNIKYYYLILYEANIFKKIFFSINTADRKELATCALGLYISLYILNLLSKKTNNEKNDKDLIENISNLFGKLFSLFTKTICFYGKYNFISTLIYLIIIIHKPLKIEYIERFIYSLQELKNVPSIILFLLYNNNIEFNLYNENNKEKFKEIKILYLEKIKHEHPFDIENLSKEFICKDENCSEYMWFNIVNSKKNKKTTENALNPIHLIKKLLNKIEEHNSVIIPDIDDTNDIEQIAIWDEIYFNIRFFRDMYVDEIDY